MLRNLLCAVEPASSLTGELHGSDFKEVDAISLEDPFAVIKFF